MPESVTNNNNSSFLGRISRSARASLASTKEIKATIQLLDDSADTVCTEFKRNDTGQVLLDYVCEYVNLIEKDYFGLRYVDHHKHRYWLDTTKPISKQIKASSNVALRLRVRYYPADPKVLKEEITRYQLFLQLRRDLLHGRLYCPQNEAAILGAYIIQSELGDYDPQEHKNDYVSEYKLFLKQTPKLEEKIAEIHQTLKGLTPAGSEMDFLDRASKLDTYGFDPHTVKDAKYGSVYLGVTHQGILVYQASRKVHHIKWNDLEKVDYLGKEFRVYPKIDYFLQQDGASNDALEKTQNLESPGKSSTKRAAEHILKYQCPSASFAKHLWRHALSQQAFFTESRAQTIKPKFSTPRIPLLFRGSTFRFAGPRVLHEIEECVGETGDGPSRPEPRAFPRYHLEKQPGRENRYGAAGKYSTLPRSHHGSKKNNTAIGTEVLLLNTSFGSDDIPSSTREAPAVMKSTSMQERISSPAMLVEAVSGRDSAIIDLSPVSGDVSSSLFDDTLNNRSSPAAGATIEREKMTTFTIHLSKAEKSPRGTPSPTIAEEMNDQNFAGIQKSSPEISTTNVLTPLANSTPKKSENNQLKDAGEKNGPILLGQQNDQNSTAKWRAGTCARLARSLLTAILLSIILVTILVAIFEVKDSAFRDYVHAIPGAENFRHQMYEPGRDYVIGEYGRLKSNFK